MTSGKISKWLLIGGGVIALVILISIIGGEKEKKETNTPVNEAILESKNIKFRLIKAEELGNILKGSESKYPEWQEDLTTEGKFIKVEVSQENVGKRSTYTAAPDIIDNQGREFSPFTKADPWIPEEKYCGLLGKELKPGFSPVNCVFIYEVPKDAKGLKLKLGTIAPNYIDLGL